jgi:hypothetical protein
MDYLTFKHFKIWKDRGYVSYHKNNLYVFTDELNYIIGSDFQDNNSIPTVTQIDTEPEDKVQIHESLYDLVAIEIHPIEGKSITLILDDYVDSIEPEVKAILVQP